MTLLQIGLFCLLITLVSPREDNWVWKNNGRSAGASPRYEIYEEPDYPDGGFGGPSGNGFNRPPYNRPPGGGIIGGRPPRPGFDRPYPGDGFVDRPGLGGNYPQYGPGFPGRPGLGGGPGIGGPGIGGPGIGGPGIGGPGFDGRPPVQQFDTCTCSERFNCKSPGISYGHCDVGKSYCCFNKHGQPEFEPAPSRPIHSPENGILVGPGHGSGGYGKPGYAPRPGLGRPGPGLGHIGGGGGGNYPGEQGILVGPGGPTGIVGRPGGYGRPGNGALVGPGGPYDRPYGRSANIKN